MASQKKAALELRSSTIQRPAHAYLLLEHIADAASLAGAATTPSPPMSVDVLTVRQLLSQALTRFLGVVGAAVAVDILRVDGVHAWIRVPSDDAGRLAAALTSEPLRAGGEGMLRIRAAGDHLAGLVGREPATQTLLWGDD